MSIPSHMAENRLTMTIKSYKAILESSPEGIFLIDKDGVIQSFNRAMEEMTGWKQEEVVGKKQCLRLFHCRHEEGGRPICRSDCPGLSVLNRPGETSHAELLLRTKSGNEIVVSAHYAFMPVQGYVIGVMKEITEKKKAENVIKIQAITDDLTGLYNFRYFRQQLDLEIKRAERYHRPLSVIMLDIDHFKHYNDLHGHPQGNEILRRMAVLLRENSRETDIVVRYGGDEFVILLPETKKRIAIQAAKRLCSTARETVFPLEVQQPGGTLTVSLGVASYPADAGDEETLVRIVDDFLYRAKQEGRNRVHWEKHYLKRPAGSIAMIMKRGGRHEASS